MDVDTPERVALTEGHHVWRDRLPPALLPDEAAMEALWGERPERYREILIHGRTVETPRWQQAYGHDYRYSGQVNEARPIAPDHLVARCLVWAHEAWDGRLNGALLNWYDGALGHYIGAHRDSTKGLIEGAPIVGISLGEERLFRMRRHQGKERVDLVVRHGDVIIIPWETNQAWTHELPRRAAYQGRRISITLRAFEDKEGN